MYKVVKATITKPTTQGEYEDEVVIIANKLEISPGTYIEVPHPITEFTYKTTSCFNSAKKKADAIVPFLNYLNGQVDAGNPQFQTLKYKGLSGLTWVHAAGYLNYCNDERNNSYDTVKSRANVIKELYAYLDRSGILTDEKVQYVHEVKNGEAIERVLAPFKYGNTHVQFPPKYKYKTPKLKDLSITHWRLFLEYCIKYEKNIALGVYFQMMGGLRNGEVVNLDIDSYTYDETYDDMKLHIKDRRAQLFKGRSINPKNNEVKKQRANQVVLNPFGDLQFFLVEHMKERHRILELKKTDTSALFVNRDGEAMTAESYQYRFKNVKKHFLKYLESIDDPLYDDYSKFKWSTHIGRGIFTNFLISQGICTVGGSFNERLLADLRGDKSTKSAKDYIDTYNLIKRIEDSNNRLVDELSKKRKEKIEQAKLVQQRSKSLQKGELGRAVNSINNVFKMERYM